MFGNVRCARRSPNQPLPMANEAAILAKQAGCPGLLPFEWTAPARLAARAGTGTARDVGDGANSETVVTHALNGQRPWQRDNPVRAPGLKRQVLACAYRRPAPAPHQVLASVAADGLRTPDAVPDRKARGLAVSRAGIAAAGHGGCADAGWIRDARDHPRSNGALQRKQNS